MAVSAQVNVLVWSFGQEGFQTEGESLAVVVVIG